MSKYELIGLHKIDISNNVFHLPFFILDKHEYHLVQYAEPVARLNTL